MVLRHLCSSEDAIVASFLNNLAIVPPQLYGLAASMIGMLAGGLLPQWIKQAQVDEAMLKRTSSIVSH